MNRIQSLPVPDWARVSATIAALATALTSSVTLAGWGPNINFPNFPSSTGLTLNGSPAPSIVASSLQMINGHGQDTSAFVTAPQDVTHDFHALYQFAITNPHSPIAANGADGLAFVVEGDPRGASALGNGGNGVGYSVVQGDPPTNQAIINSIAVVMRTYTYNVIQIDVNAAPGNSNYQAATDSIYTQTGSLPNMVNQLETVTVDYWSNNHELTVLFNGSSIGLDNVSLPQSISTILGSNTGYFGFTSGTGADWSTISVEKFTVTPEPSGLLLGAIGGVALAALCHCYTRRRGSYQNRLPLLTSPALPRGCTTPHLRHKRSSMSLT